MLIIKTKLQLKSNRNLTNLGGMQFKNIQNSTVKKSRVLFIKKIKKKVLLSLNKATF